MVFMFEDDIQKGVWVRVCFWGCSICGVTVFLVGAEGGLVRELNISWEEIGVSEWWGLGISRYEVCGGDRGRVPISTVGRKIS